MAKRRTIVNTPVGLGTPQGYQLACPECRKTNSTHDAGGVGVLAKGNISYYRFDCSCGCRYKAQVIPMTIGLATAEEVFRGLLGG